MKILLLVATTLTLYGCSSDSSGEREETVGKEIADDYNRAMQKAQDVEVQLQDSKQRVEEALREAEQAAKDP